MRNIESLGMNLKRKERGIFQILDEIYDKVAHEDDQAEVIMARQKVPFHIYLYTR